MAAVADVSPAAAPGLPGGNPYAEGVYCGTDVQKGVTRTRTGVRLCCLTTDFLTGFRRAIVDECGPAADTVFKSVGRKWGGFLAARFAADAERFHGRRLADLTMAQFRAAVADLFAAHGWGAVDVDPAGHDAGVLVVTVGSPVFAAVSGPSDRPVEALMAGVLAGFLSAVFAQDLDGVQTACVAKGDPAAVFVVALAPRLVAADGWVAAGKPHADVLAELAAVRV